MIFINYYRLLWIKNDQYLLISVVIVLQWSIAWILRRSVTWTDTWLVNKFRNRIALEDHWLNVDQCSEWALGECLLHVERSMTYWWGGPVQMATRSKARTWGHSLAGITGSNPARSMDVNLLWVLSGRRLCVGLITHPEESYRAWCVQLCVTVKPR